MHLLVAIDSVELEGEFVVEEGVEESFIECVVLNLHFEGVAAADVPSGMENKVEEFVLDDTSGLNLREKAGLENEEVGFFVGTDEDLGGAEAVSYGVL